MAGGDDPSHRRRPSLNWDRVTLVAFMALQTVIVIVLVLALVLVVTH